MAKVSKYSSYRTMTAYEAVTAWKSKRKAMRQEFEQNQTAASNALLNASAGKIDGMGTIVGQIALDRVIAEGKVKAEKQAALAKFATDVDANKADIKDSVFSGSASTTFDSGTQVNLDTGELVLSDGTTIDIKTGVKKYKVDVTA